MKTMTMDNNEYKIPSRFNVGGSQIEVNRPTRLSNNALGSCLVASGAINIACTFIDEGEDKNQSYGSMVNTFFHELTHAILRTMGETELDGNEKFVCCFSSLLTEAMTSAKY